MKHTILSFFLLITLHVSAVSNPNTKVLKVGQLADARNQVWTQWCLRFAIADTLPGFSFDSLEQKKTCVWSLPEALEPHAAMSFYSGTKGVASSYGYPVFLYLHGSGPKDIEWITGLNLSLSFDDAPSMYVIPQIPNEGKYYRWWQQSKQWAWRRFFLKVLSDPHVDPTRLYLFGISEGGYGSQRLASFYADYLAGAAPLAGGEPLRNAPAENLSNIPFSLITGENDAMYYRNRLTVRTKERLDSLQREWPEAYQHRVELEKGRGHAITYSVATPWLKQFKRQAQPKMFRWENFEMDGIKRNCFYNLQVLDEAPDKRTDYEFSVVNNVVSLNVCTVDYIITETDPQWGIELNNTRTYLPAGHGRVRIYLSEELVDLDKKVKVIVNGKNVGRYNLRPMRDTMMRSCELFGDPLRVFPASIDVEW